MNRNRLAGQGVAGEGAAHEFDRAGYRWRILGHTGFALCSCGAHSPVYDTTAARKQWHRNHKNAIRAGKEHP